MKNLKNLFLVVIVILVSACSSTERERLAMVPSDASGVVSLDVKSLIKKSGVTKKDGKMVFPEALKPLLEGVENGKMEGIEDSGIDFGEKLIAFYNSSDLEVCALIMLSDAEAMVKYLEEKQKMSLKKRADIWFYESNRDVIAIRNNIMLYGFVGFGTEKDPYMIASSILSSENKNIFSDDEVVNLLASSKDICNFISARGVGQAVKSDRTVKNVAQELSFNSLWEDPKFKGIGATIDFEKDKVVGEMKPLCDGEPEALKIFDKIIGKPSNDGLRYIPAEAPLLYGISINGEEMLKIDNVKRLLEGGGNGLIDSNDIKELIATIDGPIMMGYDMGSKMPAGALSIKCKSPKTFLKIISKFLPDVKADANGDQELMFFRTKLTLGVDGNYFYGCLGSRGAKSAYDNKLAKELFDDSPCSILFDFEENTPMSEKMSSNAGTNISGSCSATLGDKLECKGQIIINTPKAENSLQAILALAAGSR